MHRRAWSSSVSVGASRSRLSWIRKAEPDKCQLRRNRLCPTPLEALSAKIDAVTRTLQEHDQAKRGNNDGASHDGDSRVFNIGGIRDGRLGRLGRERRRRGPAQEWGCLCRRGLMLVGGHGCGFVGWADAQKRGRDMGKGQGTGGTVCLSWLVDRGMGR